MIRISKDPYAFVSRFLNSSNHIDGYDYNDDSIYDLYTNEDYKSIGLEFKNYLLNNIEDGWTVDEDHMYANSFTLNYSNNKDNCRFILFNFLEDKSDDDTNVTIVVENIY